MRLSRNFKHCGSSDGSIAHMTVSFFRTVVMTVIAVGSLSSDTLAQSSVKVKNAPTAPSRSIAQRNAGWLYANHVDRPDSSIALGDFDGDGKTDVFTGIDQRWKVSAGGSEDWKVIANAWQGVDQLGFGDANGDGRTDMLSHASNNKGAWWAVHYSPPQGHWKYLHDSRVRPQQIMYGDFNGDGLTDGFFADKDGKWYVSHSPKGRLIEINSSTTTSSAALRIADFDGDGRSDVFTIENGTWKISFGGTTRWKTVGRGTYSMHSLRFGDFNGDGRADIFYANDGAWNVHYFPFSGGWKQINEDTVNHPARFWFGDFNGDAVTDVMRNSEWGWDVSYGGVNKWSTLNDYVQLEIELRNTLDHELKVSSFYIDSTTSQRNITETVTLPAKGTVTVKAYIGSTVEARQGSQLIQSVPIQSGTLKQSVTIRKHRA